MNKAIYVVMGVTGSGKSLIGAKLARALEIDFLEGDDFHSAANIEKMSSGIPLTDGDRAEWLSTIARHLHDASAGVVISCSALKRAYRDILRDQTTSVQFIFLHGSHQLIAERIASRGGAHFMSPSLLLSQFETLESPSLDERVWMCDINDSPDSIVAELVTRIKGETV